MKMKELLEYLKVYNPEYDVDIQSVCNEKSIYFDIRLPCPVHVLGNRHRSMEVTPNSGWFEQDDPRYFDPCWLSDEHRGRFSGPEEKAPSELVLLTVDDVLSIHYALVERSVGTEGLIDPPGPRDHNLVASAVSRQSTSFGGIDKYTRPQEIAATLFYGLITNHGFHNGNKRVALVAMIVSLERNGLTLDEVGVDELYDLVMTQAQGHLAFQSADAEVHFLATWLGENTRKKKAYDEPKDLGFILYEYGDLIKRLAKT